MSPSAPSDDRLSLREEQAEVVRERIFGAAIALIEAGDEPTMRAVAKEADIGERTIYRYYASRDDLANAVRDELRARMGTALCDSVEGLEDYAAELFGSFSANAKLIQGLVHAPWAAQSFAASRASNLAAMQALIDKGFPRIAPAERKKAARTLRVALSGASWGYLTDCGLSSAEVAAQGRWVVRAMIDSLNQASKKTKNTKKRGAKSWKKGK